MVRMCLLIAFVLSIPFIRVRCVNEPPAEKGAADGREKAR